MDNGTLVAASGHAKSRGPAVRRASVVAALSLVVGLFMLVQEPADAAPRGAPAGVAAQTQTDFRQFVCPILIELRATYAGAGPFFASAVAIIDEFLVEFGCTGATTTTTLAPTTTTTTQPPTTTTTIVVPPPIAINNCATLLATRASFIGTPFAVFIPFIDIAIAAAGCVVSG